MRRSRASLLLFFATFATLLLAVGFADGGHESAGRPIDVYRLDIDEAADGWQCPGSLGFADELLTDSVEETLASNEPADVGSEGWIVIPSPGSPLTIVLYIDDELACDLACGAAAAPVAEVKETVACDNFTADAELVGCIMGNWPCGRVLAAQLNAPRVAVTIVDELETCEIDASDAMDWRQEAVATAGISCEVACDDIALSIAAAYAGVPDQLLWRQAIEHGSRCEFAWDDCQGLNQPSCAGWVDRRAELPAAELCREAGRALWNAIQWIGQERNNAISAASKQLAAWLPKATERGERAAWKRADDAGHSTSSAVRFGTLIAL